MIADIMTNKTFQAIIKDAENWICFLVFITQSYFSVLKEVRLSSTYYLLMKIHKKRELQQIAIDHLIDTDYKDFMNIYRKCTKKPYCFLTIDTRLPANHFLRFRQIFLDSS